MFDVAIVGGGPAGASCAAFCAQAGLRTLLLEREKFPREKVCGDCLNPSCWPVLRRLGVVERVHALPHGKLDYVEFIATNRTSVRLALPRTGDVEIAVKRSVFDELLLMRARELGAEIHEQTTLTALGGSAAELMFKISHDSTNKLPYGNDVWPSPNLHWEIEAGARRFQARMLVAADGRNSTVARFCHLSPKLGKERVALQTHLPLPLGFGDRVVLQFLRDGYSGQAPIGDGQLNLCLVAKPAGIARMKRWAQAEFGIASDQPWRTITPLTRKTLPAARRNLVLVGDAARVVEPFTGEGIYYALRSGELAAHAIACNQPNDYPTAHAAMYRGRLWVNQLARAAVLSPRIASWLLRLQPNLLRDLTAKVVPG